MVNFTDPDSEEKRLSDARNWARSMTVDSADYFISHCWSDEATHPGAKVRLLRNFLSLHPFLAKLTVGCFVVTLFLLPLGLGVYTFVPAFPWWALSAAIVVLYLILCMWAVLSAYDMVSSDYSPWAFAATFIWIDKTCVLQESPETISAGVYKFAHFLTCCDRMIAFASPQCVLVT